MLLYFKTEGDVEEAQFIAPKVLRFLREALRRDVALVPLEYARALSEKPYCLGVAVLDSSGRLVAVIAVVDGDLNCMA